MTPKATQPVRAARRAKVSLSPPPRAMAARASRRPEPSAEAIRVCLQAVDRIIDGESYCRTRGQIRHRKLRIEECFCHTYTFSVSDAGIACFMQDPALFFETIKEMCPHYFDFFPVLVHHLVKMPNDDDPVEPDDMSVESCEQADTRNKNVQEMRKFFYDEYVDMREEGKLDSYIFDRFPELILAEFPKNESRCPK